MKRDMKLIAVDTDEVALLRKRIRAITADGVRDALGISWDTWNKIAKGHPVSMRTRDQLSRALESTANAHLGANDDMADRPPAKFIRMG